MKAPFEENIHVHTMKHGEIERRVGDFISSLHSHQAETRGTYNRALREFLRWLSADGEFRFRSEDVERYRGYLAEERSLAGASVMTYLTALRSFCKYLVETGTLVENPVSSMGGPSTPAVQPRAAIAGEDADRLISMIPQTGELGSRDYAIVLLMLRCGLSETEIIRADIKDYDSAGATMRVQKKGRRTKDVIVTIPSEVRRAMEEYLSRRVFGEGDTPLFLSAGNRTRGMRMTTRGIRSRVNEYIEAAGIKENKSQRVTAGSLRYAMGSVYLNQQQV